MKIIFYNYITDILKDELNVDFEWTDDNSQVFIKKHSENGFDIIITYEENQISISTNLGYHDHFETDNNLEDTLNEIMGLVRDLLSNNMRIKEILSNNKPRKWLLQYFENNKWYTEHNTGLLLWNYFGKKTEKIYQNEILPPREFNIVSQ